MTRTLDTPRVPLVGEIVIAANTFYLVTPLSTELHRVDLIFHGTATACHFVEQCLGSPYVLKSPLKWGAYV